MLMIRFQRVGRTNDPAFRIVVTEKRSKPKSSGIEILGSFHPKTKETHLKSERILYWISKGAGLSPRVHNLLVAHKVIKAPKINVAKKPKVASGGETKKPEAASVAA
jgi:small subunit ribosomal protein S16